MKIKAAAGIFFVMETFYPVRMPGSCRVGMEYQTIKGIFKEFLMTRIKGLIANVAVSMLAFGTIGAASAAGTDAEPANSGGSFTNQDCAGLPSHQQLKGALTAARQQKNGGFDFDMWGAVVNRDGVVCAVAFTGSERTDQWPGSRIIAVQKANTANAFSLPGFALSTADLYAATQPGGSLFGLQASNPIDTASAYRGPASDFGRDDDPTTGHRVGGINVFGGGLALYNKKRELIGAIGVSGDSSCADHNISWRTRHTLVLDYVPAGPGTNGDDNINYMGIVAVPSLANDFSHPICKIAGVDYVSVISAALPAVRH